MTQYHLHIVLHQNELLSLKKNLERTGLNRSEYIRKLITGKRIRARPPQELGQLYYEINKIGVNVNQIARNVNAGVASDKDITQALFLLKKIYELMDKLAGQ